jgi:hypothetical protein
MIIRCDFRRILKLVFLLEQKNALVNMALTMSYDKKSIYAAAERTKLSRLICLRFGHVCGKLTCRSYCFRRRLGPMWSGRFM